MKSSLSRILIKVLIAIGIFALVTMWLWNALIPDIFGLPEIGYFQALGLLILTRLFFGGFGVLRDMSHFMAHREREAIFDSWHSMSAGQRAEYLARARSRHGRSSVPSSDQDN